MQKLTLRYSRLLMATLGYFGTTLVDGLLWDRFDGCVVEGLLRATLGHSRRGGLTEVHAHKI